MSLALFFWLTVALSVLLIACGTPRRMIGTWLVLWMAGLAVVGLIG